MKAATYTFPMWLADRCLDLREVIDLFTDDAGVLIWFIGAVETAGPSPRLLLESSSEDPAPVEWKYLVEVSRDLSQVMNGQFLGSAGSPSAQDVSEIMQAEGHSDIPGVYLEAFDSTTWTIRFIGDTVDQQQFRHGLGDLLRGS